MYRLLNKHLPEPQANAIMGLWYAALISLILFFVDASQGAFRYADL